MTRDDLLAVIGRAASEPDATAGTIADAVLEHLAGANEDAGICGFLDCPEPAVPGLECCVEHTAQQLATLRAQLRGHSA